MSQPQFVVSGASGFIGRHLLCELADGAVPVTALTRGAPSAIPSGSCIRIERVAEYGDYVPGDGAILIHLGEPSHIASVDRMGAAHIDAMASQIEALLKQPYRHVIYASSTAVYDDTDATPIAPEKPVSGGRKTYADAKIGVEKRISEIGGTVARITNVYGPGMSEANIFSDILKQLDVPDPLRIREATPVREYLWVEDLAKGLIAMAQNPRAGIFHLSSGEPIACIDLARKVLDLAGQPDRLVQALYPDRRSILRLDTSKTVATFGWEAKVTLAMGIRRLLEDEKHA